MVFSSLVFLFHFLPLVLLCYYLVPARFLHARNAVLFVFSLIFYAWGEPRFVLLMLLSVAVNYAAGLLIGRFRAREKQGGCRAVLWSSVAFNLAMIGVFKYSGFLISTVNTLLGTALPVPDIALPIGISFYTFQIMTYVIDVYRGDTPPQRSLISLGTYIAMFPQLIAGPIVRYGDIASQLDRRTETVSGFAEGVRIFVMGLAKKVLLATGMGYIADTVLSNLQGAGTLAAWTAILAYTMQIFFDFSGYSTMAVGLGRMFGFVMPENFRYPYTALSITDFWRRWHITLSTFFRDYVYIPLGGNRVSRPRFYLNIFIVWFCTGLWHGASWNFVLWGLYYAVLLLLEKQVIGKHLDRLPKPVRFVYTFLCVVFGWVIFRMESLSGIGALFAALFGNAAGAGTPLSLGVLPQVLLFVPAVLFCLPAPARLYEKLRAHTAGAVLCDVLLAALFFYCVTSLVSDSFNPFIYFRF